jgi:hypothetical protein
MTKRTIMNGLLVGAAGLPIAGLAVPYLAFFVPPKYEHHDNHWLIVSLRNVDRIVRGAAETTPRDCSAISRVWFDSTAHAFATAIQS